MAKDAHSITLGQVRDLLTGLGIEPDVENITRVTMEPGKVTVVRNRLRDGKPYIAGGTLATESVTIPVVGR